MISAVTEKYGGLSRARRSPYDDVASGYSFFKRRNEFISG